MDRDGIQAVPELVKDETAMQLPAHRACNRQAQSIAKGTGMAALPEQVCTLPAVCDVH